jgi:hypothetical protein
MRNGLQHTLAAIACLVAVTQLQRLVDAGGCAGGHRCPAARPTLQHNLYLYRGIATRVQDLSRSNLMD